MKIVQGLLALFLLLCSFVVVAINYEELFLEANLLYKKGEFENALERYTQIEPKGVAVWHNMAFCAYRLNDSINTLVYARRALLQGCYYDNRLHQLIKTAHEALRIEDGNDSWHSWIFSKISFFSLQTWQLIFLLFWIVTIFVWYTRCSKIIKFTLLSIFFLIICGFYIRWKIFYWQGGIVKTDTPMLVGKSDSFESLLDVKAGQEVTVVSVDSKWTKIIFNGISGWVVSKDVVLL